MPGLSAEDREALAESVAERLQARNGKQVPWLKTAGEAVGLVAGAVAVTYVLGGFVLAARLLLDSLTLAEAVGVVGQLSREFLITAGMVLVIGMAGLVGLVAGAIVGIFNLVRPPDPVPAQWPDLKSRILGHVPTWCALIALAVALMVPAFVLQQEEPVLSGWEGIALGVGFIAQYAAVLAVWRAIRRLALQGAPKAGDSDGEVSLRRLAEHDAPAGGIEHAHGMHRRGRGIRAGLLWAAMVLPAAVLFSSLVGFEPARVCVAGPVQGGQPVSVQGRLVADSRDAVLLIVSLDPDRERGGQQDLSDRRPREATIVRIPSSRVTRLQYGAPLDLVPDCAVDVRGPSPR